MAVRRGFTLVEILCVVVILGVASAIMIPQISSRDDLRTGAGARQVISDLTYAQNQALTTQTKIYVVFTTGNGTANQYALRTSLSPAVSLTHPVTKEAFTTAFGSGEGQGIGAGLSRVNLASASFDGKPAIFFDETGLPYSCSANGANATPLSSGSVVVTSGTDSLTVTIEPATGAMSVVTTPVSGG